MDDADFNLSSSAQGTTQTAFDFRRTFLRQWRESVRYFGFWRASRELAGAFRHALIELLPSRRKARFGDLDYDCEHEVDTTRSNVSFRSQLLAELAGRPYFASESWLFDEMMRALALSIQRSALGPGVDTRVGLQDLTFVDLGSGKGRALLMAAQYVFRSIVGVEFMPEWHRAAEENIRRYERKRGSNASPIKSLCMDARDFEFPAGPLVIYMFNPFVEPVFVAIMERLRQSLLKKPRPVFVVYRYLEFESLIEKCDWLEKVARTKQWALYRHLHLEVPNAR